MRTQFFRAMEPIALPLPEVSLELPLPSDAELLLCFANQQAEQQLLGDADKMVPIMRHDATLEQLLSLMDQPDQLLSLLPLAKDQGCDFRQLAERIWTEWPREKRAQFFQILGQ